jgi:copper chaperone CopZ
MAKAFTIEGMHCGGCVKRIETALAPIIREGAFRVQLVAPQLVVESDTLDEGAVLAAIESTGKYTLSPADSTSLTSAKAPAAAAAPINASTISVPRGVRQSVPLDASKPSWLAIYRPLLMIVGFILMVTVAAQADALREGTFSGETWMRHFMAGFFVVFAFFKLLDVRAFADAYAGYDLLAARWRPWGFIYPFVELGLGLAYLMNIAPLATNGIALAVMSFSAVGVIRAVMSRQKIRCACLGAVFNLPMSTVTIIEDLAMAAMAGWMLIWLA